MAARLRSWLRGLFGRRRVERDLAEEMSFHVAARTDHWQRQGLSPAEAARRARVEFGAVERYKDEAREARGLRWVDELRGNVAYAARRMRAAPGFTIVSVLVLGIGIGANTAVFSVVDAVMLRTLPVDRPDQLREFAWVADDTKHWMTSYDGSMRPDPSGGRIATSFAYPVYAHMRDHLTTVSDLFLFDQRTINLGVGNRKERAEALLVSGNFVQGLGARMRIGRAVTPDDDRPGAPVVAVLTHRGWLRLFGADEGVLGRSLTINGLPAAIVGVTAPGFSGLEPGWPVDVLALVGTTAPSLDDRRDVLDDSRRWAFRVMGRLKDGAVDEASRAEAQTLLRQALQFDRADVSVDALPRLVLKPGGQGLDQLRRSYTWPLSLLWTIMAAVLCIACANIAALLQHRHASRERELAVRLALGAGRGRLLRQLVTESLLLAYLGGLLGAGLALATRDGLLPLLNRDDAPIELVVGFSPTLVAFAIGLCTIVGIVCGLLPARLATRSSARLVVTGSVGAVATTRSRLLAGKSLIALQVALSFVLVVGAGLFTRTLLNLRSAPLGFSPDHVLLFELDPAASGYRSDRVRDFYQQVLERLSATPGVTAASLSRYALLSGGATTDALSIPGAAAGRDRVDIHLHYVAPEYFRAMGIPIVTGRVVSAADRDGAPYVAVVNESLARRMAGVPLGQQLSYNGLSLDVIGVVGDARFASLREPAPPTLYLPYFQYAPRRMAFAARVVGDPERAIPTIRRAIADVDPNVPMFDVRTQEAQIDAAVRQERVFAYVASGFAVLALVLACLGIYGTLAYSVAGRRPEIGLRMALGASRTAVVSMVLRESMAPVLAGIAVGLGAALAATHLIASMLFGLTPRDATTLTMATIALAASALAAAWLPARRASRVDPMTALRCD